MSIRALPEQAMEDYAIGEHPGKIIATTDPELHKHEVPRISDEFIYEFINNPVEKVLVEYEITNVILRSKIKNISTNSYEPIEVDGKIKIHNNEISMKIEKKVFTRADIIHALTYGHREGKIGRSHEDTLVEYRDTFL